MAVIHAVPAQKEYHVELSCRGFPDADLALWTQLASLRTAVQELAETKTLPPVAVLAAGLADFSVAIKSHVVGSPERPELLCKASSAAAAETEFRNKFKTSNVVEFTTDEDRPGLLADVTELLKLHDANILRAEVTSEGSKKSAKHIYEVQDATTRGRLSEKKLERLEHDFRTLRDARSPVRRASHRVSTGSACTVVHEICDAAEGVTDCLIRVSWPAIGSVDPFQAALAAGAFAPKIQDLCGLASLPSTRIQFSPISQPLVEVLGKKRGSQEFDQVLAAGTTVSAVEAHLLKKFGKFSIVTFATTSDRPGLLAEATELIRQHGANILQAAISVEPGTLRAVHTYRVEDAKTHSRLTSTTLTALNADFEILQEAGPTVRRLLSQDDS